MEHLFELLKPTAIVIPLPYVRWPESARQFYNLERQICIIEDILHLGNICNQKSTEFSVRTESRSRKVEFPTSTPSPVEIIITFSKM